MKVTYEHQGSKFLVFILLCKLECELVRLPVFKKLSFWLLCTVSKSIYLHKLFTAFTIWAVSPSIKYFLSCLREKCFGRNKARKWSLQSCPWQCWSNDPVWVWNAPTSHVVQLSAVGFPGGSGIFKEVGVQRKEVKSLRTQHHRTKAPPCLSLHILTALKWSGAATTQSQWYLFSHHRPGATGPDDCVLKTGTVNQNKHSVPLSSLSQVSPLSSQLTNPKLHRDRVEVCLVCRTGGFGWVSVPPRAHQWGKVCEKLRLFSESVPHFIRSGEHLLSIALILFSHGTQAALKFSKSRRNFAHFWKQSQTPVRYCLLCFWMFILPFPPNPKTMALRELSSPQYCCVYEGKPAGLPSFSISQHSHIT